MGPDKRRPPQRRQNAALAGRRPGDRPADRGAQVRGFRRILRELPGKRADQVAIGVAPEHLKPRQPARVKARPILFKRAPPNLADDRLLICPAI